MSTFTPTNVPKQCSNCNVSHVFMEPPVGSSINPDEFRIFFNLCFYCTEFGSSEKPLKRCGHCQLVAYCSIDCQIEDWPYHKYYCKEFPVVNGKNVLYTTGPWMEHIASLRKREAPISVNGNGVPPIFRNPRVCNTCRESQPNLLTDCKCGGVCYCSNVCVDADKSHKEDCCYLSFSSRGLHASVMFMSYPMSLMYALTTVPKHIFGCDFIPIEERTTLTIHVVYSRHLFEPKLWEENVMHKLPKLKQLKINFIMQNKMAKTPIHYMDTNTCKNCEDNDRNITTLIHQMPYHVFFSSQRYTEPDVVVIYGNKQEMSENIYGNTQEISENNDDDDIHSEISYRNMTNCQDTVLVLMDATEDLVIEGIIKVHNAQPINVLSVPQKNEHSGCGSLRKLDSGAAVINEKYYFTCLRKQDLGPKSCKKKKKKKKKANPLPHVTNAVEKLTL